MSLREKLRVMVVDDMATSRGLITQALDSIGIANVATASDGKAAIAAIGLVYVLAAVFNLYIPRTEAPLQPMVRCTSGSTPSPRKVSISRSRTA